MAKATQPPLQRQLAVVHRRLLVQKQLNALVSFWCIGLVLSMAWFLLQPYVQPNALQWHRWVVAGGLMGVATLAALIYSWMRAPSWLTAALSLDTEFQLRERVTTSLTLDPELRNTPAGQALLEDVNEKLRKLDVGSKFPVRLSWTASLVPVFAALFALVAVFYQPNLNQASAKARDDGKEPLTNASDVEQKVKDLQNKIKEKPASEKFKSEDLKRLENELEQIANRPYDNKEQVRERIKEMTALEEEMKAQEKALSERNQSLKQQLQRLDQMTQNQKSNEGPAKELQKALSEGKMDKARDEIEKIAKKMQKGEFTEKEKEMLQKQLEEMKNKLDRLSQLKEKEDQLKQMNLDPETLKRELQQLKQESEKLKGMQELAKQLNKAQQALKQGDMESLQQSLNGAGQQMKNMEGDDKDLDDLRDQLKQLQDAKDSCCEGTGENEGDPRERDSQEDSDNSGQGAGKRPLGKPGMFKSFDTKPKTEFDPKGKKIFDGYAPGQSFKRKSGAELIGEVKQASQDAPEAVEAQRIPKAAKDIAKGYFQRMREQTEKQPTTPAPK